MTDLVAAVDVGTGSARAGIFDATGAMFGRAEAPIETFRPAHRHEEQDSEAIWAAVGAALRAAREEAAAAPEAVRGLAFDATCSLVVRDREGMPLPVTPGEPAGRDTMLWLDHRAVIEAAECTATDDPALAASGGVLSPEMQLPKLLWLKRRNAATWKRLGLAFDLSDFLAWKATGSRSRSLCTLACKWGYRAGYAEPWPNAFLERIGLGDLRTRAGLPDRPLPVGSPVGPLAPTAAAGLGLAPGIPVGAGLIDAHAGALAGLGPLAGEPDTLVGHLALIAGTSNCLMALAPEVEPRRGLWGPYRDAILPGLSVQEGGQSVSGGLLDHICFLWGGTVPGGETHARIARRIGELRALEGWDLAADLHVLPDFAGNRSPLGDPLARGVISGLPLDASFDGLARLYWRTAVGLAIGLREIVALLTDDSSARPVLHLAGGHTRSPLLTGLYATATGCPLISADRADMVLLGTAMAAATACGLHPDLATAARAMAQPGTEHLPDPAGAAAIDRDTAAFRALQRHRSELAALSKGPSRPQAR